MRSQARIGALVCTAMALAATAMADINQTATLTAGTIINFDNGTTGATISGDVLFGVTTFVALGKAGVVGVSATGAAAFMALTQADLILLTYTPSGMINGASAGSIFAVKTNGGNYAKVLVVSISGSTATLQFTTFTSSSGGSTPTITAIQNNYSQIRAGLPNYGIAPGSLFVVLGSNLAASPATPLQDSRSGLKTTLNGVTVTASVNGVTKDCPLYYLSPTQIDAVLPGGIPPGTGTLTVTYNGANTTAPLTVVQSAFGIVNYNGTLAYPTDANYVGITSNNSANPGQTIIIWGSGVGADPNNDDRLFPQAANNLTNIPMQVYVGGVQASIYYRGRSQFPGVDQVIVTLPQNVPTGCFVSLAVVSGNIVSNGVTIPVAASGKTCSEPNSIFDPGVLQNLNGKTTVRFGALFLGQSTQVGAGGGAAQSSVGGIFASNTTYNSTIGVNTASVGSCVVYLSAAGVTSSTTTYLDAGASISVQGPQGSVNMTPLTFNGTTLYTATNLASNFIPASGGTFTFDNGGGGADVGHFTASTSFPANFAWTNNATVTAIDRTQGVTVTWSGGAPGVTVTIAGSSSAQVTGGNVSASFVCTAPLSAGQFTVPAPVTLALPSGSGTLSVTDNGKPVFFNASGIDLGYLGSTVSFGENVRYN